MSESHALLVWARAARLQHADAEMPMRAVATLLRSCLAFANLLGLVGCSIAPQLAPTAAGCYALQTDSVPDAFRAALVPPLPALVRLDTARGGHLQVPVEWLEAGGYRVRYAWLGLQRPRWELREGEVVIARDMGRLLPSDSLVLAFGAHDVTLTTLLAAQPSGDWEGQALVLTSFTQRGQPLLPVRLRRTECGATRLGISE